MNQDCLLLWLTFLPMVGALVTLPLASKLSKWVALVFSLIGVGLAGLLYVRFSAADSAQYQMTFAVPWINEFRIRFALGVDGLSFPLVLLTKLMMPIAILASWHETRRERAMMIAYLVLDTAMVGTFLATDIFLFYVFWELMLLPMILLIGIWGSTERIYASLKFFIYTFSGSLLMLVSVFYIFIAHQEQYGFFSAEIHSFYKLTFSGAPVLFGMTTQDFVFWGFAIAFLIKVPLFPLHTWLPDAHVQAPTGGSILLAAVLLKMGTYGLLRFAIPICPAAFLRFSTLLVVLSIIGIIYGAWVAFQQTDMKKLVAYSSVSHLGFVVLGICAFNPEGLTGAMLQMVNHGLSTGALFLMVGMLYERRHTRSFSEYGGIAEIVPFFAFFLVFVCASSMGVPGLNGFVGEFLVLFGSFRANPIWSLFAVTGVIFGATYTLLLIRRVLFGGNISAENRALKDMNGREWAALLPLCLFIIVLGVYPNFLLKKIDTTLETYWSSIPHLGAPGTRTAQETIKTSPVLPD